VEVCVTARASGGERYGGPWGTVPELLFEKKGLIPALQLLLIQNTKA